MSGVETIPSYQSVAPSECGASFNISFDDYRSLAGVAIGLMNSTDLVTGIYKLANSQGCGLDVWDAQRTLTIQVDSERQQIALFKCDDLDSPDPPRCLLSLNNSPDDWQRLSALARKEISKAT